MLKRLGDKTKDIIESKNERKWKRHQSNLEMKVKDTHSLSTSRVQLKIAENVQEDVINEWSKEPEFALGHFKQMLDEVDDILTVIKQEKTAKKQWEMDKRKAKK